MKHGWMMRYVTAAAMGLAFMGSAAALTICGACGHEATDGEAACRHCNAALPASETQPAETAVTGTTFSLAAMAETLIADDLQAAQHHYRAGEIELARRFCINASALNLLTAPGAARDARAALIVTRIEACDGHEHWGRSVCDSCGGRQRQCPRCGGSGWLRRRQTIDERKYDRGQALQRYRILQQGKTRVSVGGAWVTAALVEQLRLADEVALRRATAPGCRSCMGFGRQDCATCKGLGAQPCTAARCELGIVTTEREGLGGSAGFVQRADCQVCQGRAVIPCARCSGAGSALCRACGGSGMPPGCTRCGGDGVSACSRCRGTGAIRDVPCTACDGAGGQICRTCSGTGFRP